MWESREDHEEMEVQALHGCCSGRLRGYRDGHMMTARDGADHDGLELGADASDDGQDSAGYGF